MRSSAINKSVRLTLIERYGYLFWYVPEKEKANLSQDALVETILNYGDMESVRDLINLAGFNTVAGIFYRNTRKSRINYYPQVINFFTLYLNRHAPGNSDQ